MWSNVKSFAAVIGVFAAAEVAQAADLALPAAAPPAAAYSWSGLYLGLNAGYAGTKLTETLSDCSGSASANIPGAVGGFQIGGNYQIGAVVLGLEADFDATTATKSIVVSATSNTAQIPWIGTLRGRAGVALDRWLLYVTGGGAATELVSNVTLPGVATSSVNATHAGWTAGGGIEAAITNDLSARLEYLYLSTSTFTVAQVGGPPSLTVSGRLQDSLIRAGVNYRLPVAW
jgi:outer membrane immunogenic protein